MFRQISIISKTLFAVLALTGLATLAIAQEEAVKFPDTPAGKTVAEFFAAFNSGNIETMKKFHQAHGGPEDNAEKDKEIFEKTGGLKVHSIKRSEKTEIEVLVQTKKEGNWLSFNFNVSGEAPFAIEGIRVQPTSAPSE
jgi:hypothetical protein